MNSIGILASVLSLFWAGAVWLPSLILLFAAATWPGVGFAIGALALGIAPLLIGLGRSLPRLRAAGLIAFGVWALITTWLVVVAPDGRPPTGARVQNRYADAKWHYQRFALGGLLPEIDQFLLGFKLVPAVDSLFTAKQARSLSGLTRDIYAQLETERDFHALGSVMPEAYDEIWGHAFNHGHYFLYIPANLDRTRPARSLIFLHGSGGNFKAYTWLLSRIADELGLVIIAPSFGMGNWDAEHSLKVVVTALEDAAKVVPLDRGEIHLAGLSNGGLGVSHVAASPQAPSFRSLIFLSPVCDPPALESRSFAAQCTDKPVLIITGKRDDRVPLDFVLRCADRIKSAGAKVTLSAYSDADHFLVFSHRQQFLKELAAWLKPAGPGQTNRTDAAPKLFP